MGAGVAGAVACASTILNRVDPVTSLRPDTLTIYSSGLKDVASTGNDHVFNALLPGTIVTVPEAAENSPLWDLTVGVKEEDVISIISLSPAARFVEPVMVNKLPTD